MTNLPCTPPLFGKITAYQDMTARGNAGEIQWYVSASDPDSHEESVFPPNLAIGRNYTR